MSDVYITGIEMIPFGRYPHRTPASLGAKAVLGALDDAGITVHESSSISKLPVRTDRHERFLRQ